MYHHRNRQPRPLLRRRRRGGTLGAPLRCDRVNALRAALCDGHYPVERRLPSVAGVLEVLLRTGLL